MLPAKALYDSLAARIVSDPTKLGLATFLSGVPILAPYTPGIGLVFADLTIGTADFGPLDSTVVPISGIDPLTSQYKLLALPPAGGWKWVYGGVTPPPTVTIYGFALIDAATHLVLFAVTEPLATPEVLPGPGLVVLDELSFLMLAPPLV